MRRSKRSPGAAGLLQLALLALAARTALAFVPLGPSSSSSPSLLIPARPRGTALAAVGGGAGGAGGAGGLGGSRILTPAQRLQVNEPALREIAQRLAEAGMGKTHLVQDKCLGPGLQNQHYRFETTEAGSVFVKLNHRFGFIQIFQQEFESLRVLSETNTIRVPKPYLCGLLKNGHSFLAMEYIEAAPFGPSMKSVAASLGEGMARLHLTPVPFIGSWFGFPQNNFLGMTEQQNEWMDDFARFFIERRLMPQIQAASGKLSKSGAKFGDADTSARAMDRLLFQCEKILEPVRHCRPSLLHGDLWHGNAGGCKQRRQAFVHDPACWWGHSEFDLALSSLFGGQMPEFYQAYHALIPAEEGFEERQEVYRLYHLLYHLNNYGLGWGTAGSVKDPKGYAERAMQTIRSISSTR